MVTAAASMAPVGWLKNADAETTGKCGPRDVQVDVPTTLPSAELWLALLALSTGSSVSTASATTESCLRIASSDPTGSSRVVQQQ